MSWRSRFAFGSAQERARSRLLIGAQHNKPVGCHADTSSECAKFGCIFLKSFLTATPSENGGHREVPDRADHSSSHPSKPPSMTLDRVRSCVRPVCAARMAAGPNALRGSGPNPIHAFEDALTLAGSPDPRNNPCLHYVVVPSPIPMTFPLLAAMPPATTSIP
jgi:hypothetical protein